MILEAKRGGHVLSKGCVVMVTTYSITGYLITILEKKGKISIVHLVQIKGGWREETMETNKGRKRQQKKKKLKSGDSLAHYVTLSKVAFLSFSFPIYKTTLCIPVL